MNRPQSASTKPELVNKLSSAVSYLFNTPCLNSDTENICKGLTPLARKDIYASGTFKCLNGGTINCKDLSPEMIKPVVDRSDMKLLKQNIKYSEKETLAEKILSVWSKKSQSRAPERLRDSLVNRSEQNGICKLDLTELIDAFAETDESKKTVGPAVSDREVNRSSILSPQGDRIDHKSMNGSEHCERRLNTDINLRKRVGSKETKEDGLTALVKMLKQKGEHRRNKEEFFQLQRALTTAKKLNRTWQHRFLTHKQAEKAGTELLLRNEMKLYELERLYSIEQMAHEKLVQEPKESSLKLSKERNDQAEKQEAFERRRLQEELDSVEEITKFNSDMIVLYRQSEVELTGAEGDMERCIKSSQEKVNLFIYGKLKRKGEQVLMDLKSQHYKTHFFQESCREVIDLRNDVLTELKGEKTFLLEKLDALQRQSEERAKQAIVDQDELKALEESKAQEELKVKEELRRQSKLAKKRAKKAEKKKQEKEAREEKELETQRMEKEIHLLNERLEKEKQEKEKMTRLLDRENCKKNASVCIETQGAHGIKRKFYNDESRKLLDPRLKRSKCE